MSIRRSFTTRHRDDDDVASPAFARLFLMAIAVTVLLGLSTGVVWVLWNLVQHWLW